MNHVPIFTYKALFKEIHDGDTFTADLDCGFNVWLKNQKFRLYGINCPELMEVAPLKGVNSAGKASRDAFLGVVTKGVTSTRMVFGVPSLVLAVPVPVVIVTVKDKSEKYGRWLAKVYVKQVDGTELFVNDWLVAAGLAKQFMVGA